MDFDYDHVFSKEESAPMGSKFDDSITQNGERFSNLGSELARGFPSQVTEQPKHDKALQ